MQGNIISSYFYLTKPNVMYLSVISSLSAYIYDMSLFEIIEDSDKVWNMIFFVLGIISGSGSAGVFNMCLEVDRDKKMTRTLKRPLVNGDISCISAHIFGGVLFVMSIFYLMQCSLVSTLLLIFTIFFYCIVYTLYLKPRTDMNIVIGGIAGGIPVLIGWYANHDYFSIIPYILCLLIVLWTPAHFWALAIYKIDDYKAVGLPMRPITVGVEKTKVEIFIYTLLTVLSSYLCFLYVDHVSYISYFILHLTNLYFLYKAYCLLSIDIQIRDFFIFFLVSVKYLFIILFLFIFSGLRF